MKKTAGIIIALTAVLFFADTLCGAAEISKNFEFFYYEDDPGNIGRTDFFTGGTGNWDTDNRIDYLKTYSKFLKRYFGVPSLNEYATPIEKVNEAIANLKPQPAPLVRRVTQLDKWKWTLGENGVESGWAAPGFDDSEWNTTESMPLVIGGEETRDLWMRTEVATGEYGKMFIAFESLIGNSLVWVNGKKVIGPDAFHSDSAPFKVDLTSWLKKNTTNVVAVHISDYKQRGKSGGTDDPSKYIGWGAAGKIRLVETAATTIDNIFVYTDELRDDSAKLRVQFTLKNFTTSEFKGTAVASVRKWFPAENPGEAARAEYPVSVIAGTGSASPVYYALDFGSEDSPLMPGWQRVTPETLFSTDSGFGWSKPGGLEAVDNPDVPFVEFTEADLKRDAIRGSRPNTFKLSVSPGRWAMRFLFGSPDKPASLKVKYIDDFILDVGKNDMRPWEFTPVNITQFMRGSAAALKFLPVENGEVFTINAMEAMNNVPFTRRFEKPLIVQEPETWAPGSPNLYELRLTLMDEEGNAIDDIVTTFGIVKLEERDGDLFVNNHKYRLRGALETHSFPPERSDDLTCVSPPDRWIAQDILDSAAANMNLLRFHPAEGLGTNYQRWLEFADQLGIFIIWAPREWFHWGNHGPDYYRPLLESHLEPSMIASRNHPSIFAWEGGNETYYNKELWDHRAKQFCDEYYFTANSIDPSRFILPVSFWYAQFEGKADFYRIDMNRGNEVTYPGAGESPRSFWADNVFWDVHPYAGWYGGWMEIWWNAGNNNYYNLDKIFMVSEFGAEGMPNWELYKDERYYHTWDGASSPAKWEKERIGRNLGFDEWEISQAYQALSIYNNIAVFRTENADGLAICTGAEGRHNGKYFKGLRDMHRRPKLAYYTTGAAYSPVFTQALNGDTILMSADSLQPVIVNDGPARCADLTIEVRDMTGKLAFLKKYDDVNLPEAGIVKLDKAPVGKLINGKYYEAEYVVSDCE